VSAESATYNSLARSARFLHQVVENKAEDPLH
jgi:hypothetical protein